MKIRFEARIISYAEGVIDLRPDEIAEYRALTTDEERNVWLRLTVNEAAHDEVYESHIDTSDWRVEDE